MPGCPSFRHLARVAQRASAYAGPLAALSGLAAGCFPEQSLSSYRAGQGAEPALASATVAARPDAAAPGTDTGEPIAESDAGAQRSSGPSPPADAALPPALACRDECVCQRSGAREFMFCATLVTFEEASERCAEAGGSLASVDDEAQNTFLTEGMQAIDADDFWLSGTDAEQEGVWRWADGRAFFGEAVDGGAAAFAPWDTEQPNDLNGEDCMRSVTGLWRDLGCDDELSYVCQG